MTRKITFHNVREDFPGYRTFGRHSKYSRYKTCQPLDIGAGYNYEYDPELFPPRDPHFFRIITLNCNRFPRTLWSESILTCLLFAALPDVLILQEVKAIPVLSEVVTAVTESVLPGRFSFFSGKEYQSGLNIATVYNIDIHENPCKSEILPGFDIDDLYSLRRPVQLNGILNDHQLHFMNLHGVSRSQRDHQAIRLACLDAMKEYFLDPEKLYGMIVGGDWNIDSNDLDFKLNFPEFNVFISDYFSPTDHFIISKALISPDDIGEVLQYQMNILEYLQLREADYLVYMSDHFPVVLDIPIELLS